MEVPPARRVVENKHLNRGRSMTACRVTAHTDARRRRRRFSVCGGGGGRGGGDSASVECLLSTTLPVFPSHHSLDVVDQGPAAGSTFPRLPRHHHYIAAHQPAPLKGRTAVLFCQTQREHLWGSVALSNNTLPGTAFPHTPCLNAHSFRYSRETTRGDSVITS